MIDSKFTKQVSPTRFVGTQGETVAKRNSRLWLGGVENDTFNAHGLSRWEKLLGKQGIPLDTPPTGIIILGNKTLRAFAAMNKDDAYIPEATLKAWGLVVDLSEFDDTVWQHQIIDAFREARQ